MLACSSHVCRNVRHCSCLFRHVLLIAIDLIFLQPSTVLQKHREPSTVLQNIASLPLCCRNSASLLLCCSTIASVIQPWKDRAGSSEAVQAAGVICKLKLYVRMFILCVSCCMWCVCILLQLLFTLWPLSVSVLLCLLRVEGFCSGIPCV